MRRRTELARKLRVKVLEDRQNGLTYEQIQQRRGVSSRTIAELVKGKDLKRFCQHCGETDPEKLETHHPDRVNSPTERITMCASCHSKVTREQQRKRNREIHDRGATQEVAPSLSFSTVQNPVASPPANDTQLQSVSAEDARWIARWMAYGAGGICLGEAVFDSSLSGWARWILGITGLVTSWAGSKI